MYKDSKRTCTAIVLLIKPFVWRRSRRSRRRGLLKLPIVLQRVYTSKVTYVPSFFLNKARALLTASQE